MYKYITILLVCFFNLVPNYVYGQDRPVYKVGSLSNDFSSNIIFEYLGRELDLNFEHVKFSNFGNALDAVRYARVDFMANTTYTEQRGEWLQFSEPINSEFIYIFSTNDNVDLDKNQTFGVMSHSIYTELLPIAYPNAIFIEYHDIESAKQLLFEKKVEGIIGDTSYLKSMIESDFKVHSLEGSYSSHQASIVAPKGKHIDIIDTIQEHLLTLKFQQHFKTEVRQYEKALRTQQLRKDIVKSGLNSDDVFKVTFNKNNSSSIYAEGGVLIKELVEEICQILQLKCAINIDNEHKPENDFLHKLKSGKTDVVVPIALNGKRSDEVYFSTGFFQENTIFVKRAGYKNDMFDYFAELFREKIGVAKNSYNERLVRVMFPEKELITFHSNEQLIDALIDGTIDYAFLNQTAYNSVYASSNKLLPVEEDTRLGITYQYDLAFAFPKTDEGKILSELFSGAMELINIDSLAERYDIPFDWHDRLRWKKKIRLASYVGFFFIGLLLLIAMSFFYSKSLTDDLTKLKNRLALYKKYGKKFNKSYSVVYLDVNKFKFINDNFGHDAGDDVLKLISERIRKYWKGQGYRIGGDEFVLVFKGNPDDIDTMLKQIRNISVVLGSQEESHEVTLSIGIVKPRERNMPMDEVLLEADERMYRSKARFRETER